MATDYTRQWISFFTGCGIPIDVATSYGLIFNENRIQKNMLLDLNKEYLRDMGITVLGDVIAILRHAKVVHDKYAREQVLSDSLEKVDSCDISDDSPKKATPMKRMLDHYTRKYDSPDLMIPHERVQIQIENDTSPVNVPRKLAHRIGGQNKVGVRQKIEAPAVRGDEVPSRLEVPVPKIRKVLPENEGGYTIKMPSGTTERSKKILEKAKMKQSKTVFDRLGESSVSSTSDVTGSIAKTGNRDKANLSVFSRLGEKSALVTSTSSNGDTGDSVDQLPYRGILKADSVRKKLSTAPNSTMRADDESDLAKINSIKRNKNLKDRLGTAVKGKPTPGKDSETLSRMQIITTFEEDDELPQSKQSTLSKRFKYMNETWEKKNFDGVGTFRSESMQNKAKVTSTTALPDTKRGIKRRLESIETKPDSLAEQSKKVRFGRTTKRLIPSNQPDTSNSGKTFKSLTMRVDNNEIRKQKTLTSGVRIGPLNSDKAKQKPSVKDRIGGVLLKGRAASDAKRKRPLKLGGNRLKQGAVSVHDRLG